MDCIDYMDFFTVEEWLEYLDFLYNRELIPSECDEVPEELVNLELITEFDKEYGNNVIEAIKEAENN